MSQNGTLQNIMLQNGTALQNSHKTVHSNKPINVTKQFFIKMAPLKNGTLQTGTDIMVHYITVHYTTVCRTNLTLDMVSHNQQNPLTHGLVGQGQSQSIEFKSTHGLVGRSANLTYPNSGYGQSQSTELQKPLDWLDVKPNLTSVIITRTPPTHGLLGRLA
jgi:hypothetical protein